jgi:hypothetical protein
LFTKQRVKVAKLVPDKPLKPIDTSESLGIRFDKNGDCMPHSILGSVEDYLQESLANGKSLVNKKFHFNFNINIL